MKKLKAMSTFVLTMLLLTLILSVPSFAIDPWVDDPPRESWKDDGGSKDKPGMGPGTQDAGATEGSISSRSESEAYRLMDIISWKVNDILIDMGFFGDRNQGIEKPQKSQ